MLNGKQRKILNTLETRELTAKQISNKLPSIDLPNIKANIQLLKRSNRIKKIGQTGREHIYKKNERNKFMDLSKFRVIIPKEEKKDTIDIPIELIIPNPFNVNVMSKEKYEGLKKSIAQTELKYIEDEPITVFKYDEKYWMIDDGEHRWKVCKELGYKSIPAVIKDIDIEEAKKRNLIYNKNRGTVNIFRESKLINDLYESYSRDGWNREKIANIFGYKSESTISNIKKIYPRLKKFMEKKELEFQHFSNSHLEFFSRCNNELLRGRIIDYAYNKELSIIETKNGVRNLNAFDDYLKEKLDTDIQRSKLLSLFSITFLINNDIETTKKMVDQFISDNIIFKYIEKIKNIPIDENEQYIDIFGKKFGSKGEVNISNVLNIIFLLTDINFKQYHPVIIKFDKEERKEYERTIDPKLLSEAEWTNFPYQIEGDIGMRKFPNVVIEYFGWHGIRYEARRKIKEIIYEDKNKQLISVEKDEDANFPYLFEKIIKELHLRKKKEFRGKI